MWWRASSPAVLPAMPYFARMRRLALLLFLALPLLAQNKDDALLDQLYAVKHFEDVAISADGARVAWTITGDGVYLAKSDGSGARRVLEEKGADENAPAFSPDSKSLAFLSDGQLVIDGAAVTKLRGYLAEPKWSPDGKSVAFLFIENAGRAAGPLVATARAVGAIDEQIEEQRVAIFDVATKKVRIVTPDNLYVYHFDW